MAGEGTRMNDEVRPRTVTRWGAHSVVRLGVLALCVATLLGSGVVALSTGAGAAAPRHSGSVDVLYAGSLLDLMQQTIEPAFHRATGYSVVGIANGSNALANEIKGGTEVADVFISAAPSANTTLEGPANGNWISGYREFGRSPLVLGYNPSSRFARWLRTDPWFDVVGDPGFLLGRTDPATDPKGVLAVDALTGVALSFDRPALGVLATSTSNVFTETSLVGELQAGQLDAGFFYGVESSAAHLHTVPLVGTGLHATYTIALLKRSPHPNAARAFLAFLLSPEGRKLISRHGIAPVVPATNVPSSSG